jgi:PAS domain S-box-containing protein/putative nucleotidyltransferase with HDIG domain
MALNRFSSVWQALTAPAAALQTPSARRQAQFLAGLILVWGGLNLIFELVYLALSPDHQRVGALAILLGNLVGLGGAYALSRTTSYRWGFILAVVGYSTAICARAFFVSQPPQPALLAFLAIPLLAATVFFKGRDVIFMALAYAIVMLLMTPLIDKMTVADIVEGPLGFILIVAAVARLLTHYRDRLEAERRQELAAREERYRTLLETSYEGLCIHADGTILDATPGFARLFGYTLEEVVGYPLSDIMPKGARPSTQPLLGGADHLQNKPIRRRDGSVMYVETISHPQVFQGRPAYVTAVRDITERVQAELALAENEQLYGALFKHANDAILLFSPAGVVVSANQKAADLLGFSVEELTGLRLPTLVAAQEADEAQKVFDDLLAGQTAPLHERMLRRKDRTEFPAEFNAALVHSANHSPLCVQAVVRDITSRKRAEAALHESEERYRSEALRAGALTRFAARLSAQLDYQAVLQTICEETGQALGVPAVLISQLDERQGCLQLAAAQGLPAAFCQAYNPLPDWLRAALSQPTNTVLVTLDVRSLPEAELYAAAQVRSLAATALLYEGRFVGGLQVFAVNEVRYFTEPEQELLKGLADQAALALNNARLYTSAQRRLSHVQSLHDIDMAITGSQDLGNILAIVLERTTTQLGVDAAAVLLLEAQSNRLTYAGGRGFHTAALQHTRLGLGQGFAGQAALERRMIYVPNLSTALASLERAPLLPAEGFQAYFGLPLIAKGRVVGVMEVFHRSPLDPDPEWLDFLETIGGQAAIAIDNVNLFNDLQRSNVELTLAYDATIDGWSHALDLRDRETEGHTRRVTELTVHLARDLGFNETELPYIQRGAILHDIGKMGVPDQILLKPGPLTEAEWRIMRRHPEYAYEMLAPINFLNRSIDVPYCHHEKWDGTGYPRRLKGEAIPLTARIFSVVDVWDALRSDRPYRRSWSQEKVSEYLRAQAGHYFDPQIVEAFLKLEQ